MKNGTVMICPECGAAAKSGKVYGGFHFQEAGQPNAARLLLWLRPKQCRLPIFLEARAAHCDNGDRRRFRWLGIDDTTLLLRRQVQGKPHSWPVSGRTLPGGICPDCGQQLAEGFVQGLFKFQSDEPEWGFRRQIFKPIWRVKAPACFCYGCQWIRVQGSRFVIPEGETGVILYHE